MAKIFRRNGNALVMYVYDIIGWGVYADDVARELGSARNIKTINVRINSWGGLVNEAAAIWSMLKRHSARVEVDIDGVAASAATIIASAGDVIRVSPAANTMIHNPWNIAWGDHRDMETMAKTLRKVRDAIVNVYVMRTGRTAKEMAKLMDAETWFTAADYVAGGFADEESLAPEVDEGEPPEIDAQARARAKHFAKRYRNAPSNLISYFEDVDAAPEQEFESRIAAMAGGSYAWDRLVPVKDATTGAQQSEVPFADAFVMMSSAAPSREPVTATLETTAGHPAPAEQIDGQGLAPVVIALNEPSRANVPDAPGGASNSQGDTSMSLKKALAALLNVAETASDDEFVAAAKAQSDESAGRQTALNKIFTAASQNTVDGVVGALAAGEANAKDLKEARAELDRVKAEAKAAREADEAAKDASERERIRASLDGKIPKAEIDRMFATTKAEDGKESPVFATAQLKVYAESRVASSSIVHEPQASGQPAPEPADVKGASNAGKLTWEGKTFAQLAAEGAGRLKALQVADADLYNRMRDQAGLKPEDRGFRTA